MYDLLTYHFLRKNLDNNYINYMLESDSDSDSDSETKLEGSDWEFEDPPTVYR